MEKDMIQKNKYFALFATYTKINMGSGENDRISLSAPFIVSNDKFLRDAIGQCKKLKLPFRLVGFFQPLNDLSLKDIFLNAPEHFSSEGRGFDAIKEKLFSIARSMDIELLYQGFLKGDNEHEIQNT